MKAGWQKYQFSNFSVNWRKFGLFKNPNSPSLFINWKKLGNIRSHRPTFQNPNVESMDNLGKLMS